MAYSFPSSFNSNLRGFTDPGMDLGRIAGLDSSKEVGGFSKMFDPVTLGLGVANLGASIFGGIGARNAQTSAANAQMRAAADQLKWQTALGREQAKGQMGSEIAGRVWQSTTAPDLELGRQKEAAMFEAGPLAARQLAADADRARQEYGLRGSGEAVALRQKENRDALKRSIAERQAALTGMYGRIAPINIDTLVV